MSIHTPLFVIYAALLFDDRMKSAKGWWPNDFEGICQVGAGVGAFKSDFFLLNFSSCKELPFPPPNLPKISHIHPSYLEPDPAWLSPRCSYHAQLSFFSLFGASLLWPSQFRYPPMIWNPSLRNKKPLWMNKHHLHSLRPVQRPTWSRLLLHPISNTGIPVEMAIPMEFQTLASTQHILPTNSYNLSEKQAWSATSMRRRGERVRPRPSKRVIDSLQKWLASALHSFLASAQVVSHRRHSRSSSSNSRAFQKPTNPRLNVPTLPSSCLIPSIMFFLIFLPKRLQWYHP